MGYLKGGALRPHRLRRQHGRGDRGRAQQTARRRRQAAAARRRHHRRGPRPPALYRGDRARRDPSTCSRTPTRFEVVFTSVSPSLSTSDFAAPTSRSTGATSRERVLPGRSLPHRRLGAHRDDRRRRPRAGHDLRGPVHEPRGAGQPARLRLRTEDARVRPGLPRRVAAATQVLVKGVAPAVARGEIEVEDVQVAGDRERDPS